MSRMETATRSFGAPLTGEGRSEGAVPIYVSPMYRFIHLFYFPLGEIAGKSSSTRLGRAHLRTSHTRGMSHLFFCDRHLTLRFWTDMSHSGVGLAANCH